MNDLHVTTNLTADPLVFETCWMTGLMRAGRMRVRVPNRTNGLTIAELAALQHLLVEKNVCGHDKAGAGLRLHVSNRDIPDLAAGVSSKDALAPYANFLRTRFLGAEIIHVDAPFPWADSRCDVQVESIDVEGPQMTVLEVAGIGSAELTAHAVQQYVARFDRKPVRAWRELNKIAREAKPATLIGRNVMHDIKHRRPGRYVVDEKRQVMLVIVDPARLGWLPRVVTIVHPEDNVRIDQAA